MKEPWSKKPFCHEPFGALYTEMKETGKKVKLVIASWNESTFRRCYHFPYLEKIPCFYSSCSRRLCISESVILAATMMDDCMKKLAQLFYCLHTLRNMPSLGGYHSIKPRHSSLPETLTGLPHGLLVSLLSLAVITLEPAQS